LSQGSLAPTACSGLDSPCGGGYADVADDGAEMGPLHIFFTTPFCVFEEREHGRR
jgi:hypothetical protein